MSRNVLLDPQLLLGGGAVEMAVSKRLMERSRALTGIEQWPYRAVAQALEVIPRTLIQNCGASTIRVLTSLRVQTLSTAAPSLLRCCLSTSLLIECVCVHRPNTLRITACVGAWTASPAAWLTCRLWASGSRWLLKLRPTRRLWR